MAGNLPEESEAGEEYPDITVSLEKSLEKLSVQKQKPDPDISRLGVSKAQDPLSTSPSSSSYKTGKEGGRNKKTKEREIVADSWEDEISSSGSSSETETENEEVTKTSAKPSVTSLAAKSEGPLAPPPTPASGNYNNNNAPFTTNSPSSINHRGERTVRPEKQTAVASRMIAGALGLRAPKRTEEQRAYDRAVKEKEIKRRNREKEEAAKAREEEERAKAAVWDE